MRLPCAGLLITRGLAEEVRKLENIEDTLLAMLRALARLPYMYTSLGRPLSPPPCRLLRRTFSTYTSPVVSVPERAPVSHMCGASSTLARSFTLAH